MISQLVGPIEYAIRPELLSGAPSGLQQTFNLAALEIVAGETVAYLHRLPGYFEEVSAGTFQIKRVPADPPEDPSGLKRQGWERLRPYLRDDLGKAPAAGVRAAIGKRDGGSE